MIGEQGIIHNAGESDATLRLLHDDRISAPRRPSPPEDTPDVFQVVLRRLRRPHLSRALFMCSCISSQEFGVRPTAAAPDHRLSWRQTTRGNGWRGSIMRASEEMPTCYFHLILGAFIIHTRPDSNSSAGIDRPASGKKNNTKPQRMDIIFPTERWGVRINVPTVG